MLKKIVSSISIFSLLSFGTFSATQAADKPASWLPVTADGVRGSAPNPNKIQVKHLELLQEAYGEHLEVKVLEVKLQGLLLELL